MITRTRLSALTPLALALLLVPAAPALADQADDWQQMQAEHEDLLRLAQGDGERFERKKRKRVRRGHKMSDESRKELREKVQRKMQTFITVELSSQLGLDEKKALKLSAAVKQHQQRSDDHRQAVRDEYRKLKELLEDGGASDSALKSQTAKVIAAAKMRQDESGLFDATRAFLSVEEQAKLVLAFPHVRKQMRRMMHHAKVRARGRGAPPPPPGDDDDDDLD